MEEMCSLMFLFSSTICHKKRNIFHKAQFKTNKTVADRKNGYKEQLHYRLSNIFAIFQTKSALCTTFIISSFVRFFLGENPSNSSSSSPSNIIFKNDCNVLYNGANIDISDTDHAYLAKARGIKQNYTFK